MFNSQLTVFVCVADCGSFNKAAEQLYISPPAVMKKINALEKHLDMKLFDRTSQGIRLTAAGKVIYRHARFLIDNSDKAIEEAKQAADTLIDEAKSDALKTANQAKKDGEVMLAQAAEETRREAEQMKKAALERKKEAAALVLERLT